MLSLCHEFGAAYCAEWYPYYKSNENFCGILAVCFSNGSVSIFQIPNPLKLESINILIDPVVTLTLNNDSLLSLKWLPCQDEIIIAVGSSKGTVAVFDLVKYFTETNFADPVMEDTLLAHFPAIDYGVRTLCWVPENNSRVIGW